MSEYTKFQEELQGEIALSEKQDLVLYDDDFNTFDHVIDTLIDVCNHEEEQAEQCALLTHLKGKCAISSGLYEELKSKQNIISELGLTVKIQ
jgi:ATP-dependent Clp protease adaptor protein ClpS